VVHPRGGKTERARKKQPRRERYTYPMVIMGAALGTVYGRVSFSSQATREKHLIRSLSRHALLLPASCHPRSRDPPRPRFSVFHPVADKTSFLFPLLEFLGIPLHQIPFANSNLFPSSASFHPIPILSFSTARPPLVPLSSNLMACNLSQ